MLNTLSGVSYLAKGDESFQFESDGTLFIINSGDKRKIVDGRLNGKTLYLTWVGRPDMVFVNYLIEKQREVYRGSWLKEGF